LNWYVLIKDFYEKEYWTKEQVAEAVQFEKITAEQYEEIVGEPFTV
jgi:uncharacterized XkdX family phage protein